MELTSMGENDFLSAKKYDLSERLEDFAAEIIKIYNKQPLSFAADYLAKQLIRSACSTALNYGEVLGAVTSKDKSFKLSICLKELRECNRNLNIQRKAGLLASEIIKPLIDENDQLIRNCGYTYKK
tara:strand:- start:1536 stop:1913 length:378 start_codon:yes stop_codon:yes gene_type:complete